jgi:hypothetical protein
MSPPTGQYVKLRRGAAWTFTRSTIDFVVVVVVAVAAAAATTVVGSN